MVHLTHEHEVGVRVGTKMVGTHAITLNNKRGVHLHIVDHASFHTADDAPVQQDSPLCDFCAYCFW